MNYQNAIVQSEDQLKRLMATTYQKQITNYLGDEKKALRFLSGVVAAVQRNPKLLECTQSSLMNSFMTMAQLDLMPSDVSGEAYVIPYNNSKNIDGKWVKVMEAQFQLGYQGLVTLFYRAGVKKIVSEIVYEKDEFRYMNGEIYHTPDVFADDRGKPIGAYTIVELGTGSIVNKVMSAKEILGMGERFSKSWKTEQEIKELEEKKKKVDSPWFQKNDPQLWMWRKTTLKQIAKLVPKNDRLIEAIGKDNEDSVIHEERQNIKDSLKLGAVETPQTYDNKNTTTTEETTDEAEEIEKYLDENLEPKDSNGSSGDGAKDGLSA